MISEVNYTLYHLSDINSEANRPKVLKYNHKGGLAVPHYHLIQIDEYVKAGLSLFVIITMTDTPVYVP